MISSKPDLFNVRLSNGSDPVNVRVLRVRTFPGTWFEAPDHCSSQVTSMEESFKVRTLDVHQETVRDGST
jgi:hypothetical protein